MALFYVETGMGACVRAAVDKAAAHEAALREVGTYNGVQVVRLATEDDLAWVRAMGGYIPEDNKE